MSIDFSFSYFLQKFYMQLLSCGAGTKLVVMHLDFL